jgi:hypothetical protein
VLARGLEERTVSSPDAGHQTCNLEDLSVPGEIDGNCEFRVAGLNRESSGRSEMN